MLKEIFYWTFHADEKYYFLSNLCPYENNLESNWLHVLLFCNQNEAQS